MVVVIEDEDSPTVCPTHGHEKNQRGWTYLVLKQVWGEAPQRDIPKEVASSLPLDKSPTNMAEVGLPEPPQQIVQFKAPQAPTTLSDHTRKVQDMEAAATLNP